MFHLVPYLTTLDNVLLPTLCPNSAAPSKRARELLKGLGIAHRASHLPTELSAGERQRCAVARALLNEPSVILADEPTGNLDSESADLVMRMLESNRQEGATVLLVSHHHTGAIQPDLHFNLSNGVLEA
jgi:ABC-type lipoprotein export system ATPase subunit